MVACLSPSDKYMEENLSTLNYASRASQISNLPTKNIDPKMLIMNDQKKKIGDLEKELKNANDHIQNLSLINHDKDLIIEKLNRKLQKQQHLTQQTQKALNKLQLNQTNEPISPTSPKSRAGGLGTRNGDTTLPDISSKSG